MYFSINNACIPRCLSRKADQVEAVEADLATAKTGLAAKTVELAEIQEKLNDNYRLVAKLSSENLKLSGEKVRADELVAQVLPEFFLKQLFSFKPYTAFLT